jgi:phosphoribosylglycinamide formyltransferase-1
MLTIAVFGSGRGSNFGAVLSAMRRGTIPGARIALVVSNNSDAGILTLAREAGIPAVHCSRPQFPSDSSYAGHLVRLLKDHDVTLIALAGYMKQVPSAVVEAWRNRIVNIHPALLPKFGGPGMYGMRVHEAVIAAGERTSGATVHLVDEEYDRGAVLLQREVAVDAGEDAVSLAAKVLAVEHELYPEAIRRIASGALVLPAGAGEPMMDRA